MRTIDVRRKGTALITEMFKFNRHNTEQVAMLAQYGHICYIGCLLMNADIWNSTVAINGDWAFWDGQQVMFVRNVDRFFEPLLAMYGGDSRTIEQVWRQNDGT